MKFFSLCLVLVIFLSSAINAVRKSKNNCVTPNGEKGNCISVQKCGYLQTILEGPRPLSENTTAFLRKSECVGKGQHTVCCQKIEPEKLLPSRTDCGKTSSDDRISGGVEAALDEFPWTVLIEYYNVTNRKLLPLCGGTLISSRYVVTAAHCNDKKHTIPSVRIGEHNVETIVDCQKTAVAKDFCNDPLLRVDIDKFINHPMYTPETWRHDIALIRLKQEVTFNDFVSPICLPISDITTTYSKQSLRFDVAGWGYTEDNAPSEKKLKINLPYEDFDNCNRYYSKNNRPLDMAHQVCVGGVEGKDTCYGDSGGPLMYEVSDEYLYELAGVVSFGVSDCTLGLPGIYTKVFPYLNWIKSELKP